MKDDFIFLYLYTIHFLWQLYLHRAWPMHTYSGIASPPVQQTAIKATSSTGCHCCRVKSQVSQDHGSKPFFFLLHTVFPVTHIYKTSDCFVYVCQKCHLSFLRWPIAFFIVSIQILHISKYLSLKFDMTYTAMWYISQQTPLGMEIRLFAIIFYGINSIKYEICIEKIVQRIIIFID